MWKRTILLLALAWTADAQIINTVVGGGSVIGANFGLIQPWDAAVDSAGNFYVALPVLCQVWVLNSSGVITRVIGNGVCGYSGDGGPAAAASLNNPQAVAVDRFGVLYIADTNNNKIRMVSGGIITSLVAQIGCPFGIALDSSVNLYIADYCNNQIKEVVPGGSTTIVAGIGTPGAIAYNGDNIPATSARLSPNGVAVDSAGNIYIADSYNNRIRKVSGGTITTVAGNGTAGYNGDNINATSAELSGPTGVVVDDSGNLYVADKGNSSIRKVSGGIITTLANSVIAGGISISGGIVYVADTNHNRIGTVTGSGFTPVAGTGMAYGADGITLTTLVLGAPSAVAVDAVGNLYIADSGCVVWKVATGTGIISTAAGTGVCGYNGDNISAASAQLNGPAGLVTDNAGNLYIADGGNNRVRKVAGGIITTVAGNGVAGFTGDSMSAAAAELNSPMGLALDRSGNLYIADFNNNRIRKVSGGIISTFAGNGIDGFGELDSNPLSPLEGPTSVAVDGVGTVYLAEIGNYVLRKVSGGLLSTVPLAYYGIFASGFFDTGTTHPIGLAVDNDGNLVYSDPDNAVIRKVVGGTVGTIIGTGHPGFSGDGGPAMSATVNQPLGLAVDSHGDIYVADSLNNRIREAVFPPDFSSRVVIESPLAGAVVSGVITVSGWAVNQLSGGPPISSVQVQLNGTFVGDAVYGISRPDVCANYPGRPNCPNVGFSFSLYTALLAGTSATITVSATDTNGNAGLGITSLGFSVVDAPPVPNCVGMFSNSPSPFQSLVCSGINQGVFQGSAAVSIGTQPTYFGAMTLVGNVPFGDAAGMALYNAGGGAGASVSLDLYNTPYNGGIPQAKIKAIDDGNYSDHLTFWTKTPGAGNNPVTEKLRITSTGNVGIGTTNPTLGPLQIGSGAYVTAGGVWTNASDRNLKENFVPVTPAAILQKIDALPLLEWNYKNEDPSVRHIGPVAQDFYSIFGVGNTATSISTIDPSGIALAGIQGLDEKSRGRAARLTELKERLDAKTEEIRILRERLARLESLLEQTTSGSNIR